MLVGIRLFVTIVLCNNEVPTSILGPKHDMCSSTQSMQNVEFCHDVELNVQHVGNMPKMRSHIELLCHFKALVFGMPLTQVGFTTIKTKKLKRDSKHNLKKKNT